MASLHPNGRMIAVWPDTGQSAVAYSCGMAALNSRITALTGRQTTMTRPYRSVSQVKQYSECPYRYYLSRIAKAWERPAAWLPQGTGVHSAVEAIEKSGRTLTLSEAEMEFARSYAESTNKALETTPNTNYWFASGPYEGEVDIERRFEIGRGQVAKYVDWYQKQDGEIWTAPDGTPGVELPFEIELDGVPVRGFIDQVWNEPAVVDVKTGIQPGDEFQLAVYAVAMRELYGLEVNTGYYWMARTGKLTKPYDLSGWTRERVAAIFRLADESITAERFDADPEPKKCERCPVALACPFKL